MVTDTQVITDGNNQKKKEKKEFLTKTYLRFVEIARPIGNGQRTLDKIIYVYVRLRKNKAKIHLIIAGQT